MLNVWGGVEAGVKILASEGTNSAGLNHRPDMSIIITSNMY